MSTVVDRSAANSTSEDFTIRPLCEADLEQVRLLRNKYRASFFDQREIAAEDQRRWFASLAARPIEFFVLKEGDRVIGTVSLTTRAEGIEVGNVILDEACRGKGYMSRAIKQIVQGKGKCFAQILPHNIESQRLFARIGFAEMHRHYGYEAA